MKQLDQGTSHGIRCHGPVGFVQIAAWTSQRQVVGLRGTTFGAWYDMLNVKAKLRRSGILPVPMHNRNHAAPWSSDIQFLTTGFHRHGTPTDLSSSRADE